MISPLDQARQHFTTGVEHFQAQRLAQAEESFRAALALVHDRPSVLVNLASVLARQGRLAEAAPLLERAVLSEPDNEQTWSQLGTVCAQLGDTTRALAAFDQALALDDRRADDWSRRGTVLRELSRLDDAAHCFERALALGADEGLNRYYLASVRDDDEVAQPARHAPRAYVESLFDAYADEFQAHLVEGLRYQAHRTLVQAQLALGPARYASVLDLGCGTGLCGELMTPHADAIDGVDLSSRMLAQARAGGAYRKLFHADVIEHLRAEQGPRDLVLAADVFIYVGALDEVFAEVARILVPGGWFAFSVEHLEGEAPLRLMPSLRYAHSRAGLVQLAAAHGFEWRHEHRGTIREEQQQPIDGLYVHLRRVGGGVPD